MKDALLRGLVGSAIVLLAAGAFALAILGYKAVVPAQVEHDSANFTQADLDQARAKWAGQNIAVYEVTASDARRHVRLRVDKPANRLYLLELTIDGVQEGVEGLNTPLDNVGEAVYKPLTVDGLFDKVSTALKGLSTGQSQPVSGEPTTYQDVEVKFDPTRGYPASFTQYTRTTLDPNELTWRSKEESVEISDVTVIR